MKKIILILFFYFNLFNIFASQFGYVGCSTENLGDDIQAIAAKRFLPENSIEIERDFIGDFQNFYKISTIVNGWFMLENNFYDPSTEFKYNWPPSASIDPLLISLHFTPGFISTVLSKKNKQYLIDYGPVGARDYYTLKILQKNHIPSYFSGCLTLTLENCETERIDIVYAVDIDEECVNFIRANTDCPVEEITHNFDKDSRLDTAGRLKLTEAILNKYRKAKYVVTSRLHVAMPCLAFNTPVLLINIPGGKYRFFGLKELTHNCNRKTFLAGKSNFNLKIPPENPQLYVPIRENLIQLVTDWVYAHLAKSEKKD